MVGVGILIFGVSATVEQIDFLNRAVQTKGVIVDTFWDSGSDAEFPVFYFVDLNGLEHNVRGYAGNIYSASDIGREVDIYYDPEEPAHAVSLNFLDMWGSSIALLGGGFFIALSSGFFFLRFDRVIGN
jgi:hypothetical protein